MTCWGLPIKPESLAQTRDTRPLEETSGRWALPPTYPILRKTAWLPRGALPITATTLCVLKVRSCAGGPSTVEIEVIRSERLPDQVRTECLPPKQKRRFVALTMHPNVDSEGSELGEVQAEMVRIGASCSWRILEGWVGRNDPDARLTRRQDRRAATGRIRSTSEIRFTGDLATLRSLQS